jgi:phage-related protein
MPRTEVCFYRELDGSVPVRDWLLELRKSDRQAFAKCFAGIRRLAAMGHELRRPHVDLLRDGIYELRLKKGRVNYRLLYFFYGRDFVVLAHGLTKEKAVPEIDIERAVRRKRLFERDPKSHRAQEEVQDA